MAAAGPALVLFGHGARGADWALPFRKIRDRLRADHPALTVELAFLELMAPALPDAIAALAAAGHERITVAPLFVAPGGHLKSDLPKILDAIRARHPGIAITLLPTLGEVDTVLAAIADWLAVAAR